MPCFFRAPRRVERAASTAPRSASSPTGAKPRLVARAILGQAQIAPVRLERVFSPGRLRAKRRHRIRRQGRVVRVHRVRVRRPLVREQPALHGRWNPLRGARSPVPSPRAPVAGDHQGKGLAPHAWPTAARGGAQLAGQLAVGRVWPVSILAIFAPDATLEGVPLSRAAIATEIRIVDVALDLRARSLGEGIGRCERSGGRGRWTNFGDHLAGGAHADDAERRPQARWCSCGLRSRRHCTSGRAQDQERPCCGA